MIRTFSGGAGTGGGGGGGGAPTPGGRQPNPTTRQPSTTGDRQGPRRRMGDRLAFASARRNLTGPGTTSERNATTASMSRSTGIFAGMRNMLTRASRYARNALGMAG